MSEQPSKEERTLEFQYYAVVDKAGIDFRALDMKDAVRCLRKWDVTDPKCGPHRIVEVLWREVKP